MKTKTKWGNFGHLYKHFFFIIIQHKEEVTKGDLSTLKA
jgi:hypothetical protein